LKPTAHLDKTLSLELMEILSRLKTEGKPRLLGSHDPLVCDFRMVDRVVSLRVGRIEDLSQ